MRFFDFTHFNSIKCIFPFDTELQRYDLSNIIQSCTCVATKCTLFRQTTITYLNYISDVIDVKARLKKHVYSTAKYFVYRKSLLCFGYTLFYKCSYCITYGTIVILLLTAVHSRYSHDDSDFSKYYLNIDFVGYHILLKKTVQCFWYSIDFYLFRRTDALDEMWFFNFIHLISSYVYFPVRHQTAIM